MTGGTLYLVGFGFGACFHQKLDKLRSENLETTSNFSHFSLNEP